MQFIRSKFYQYIMCILSLIFLYLTQVVAALPFLFVMSDVNERNISLEASVVMILISALISTVSLYLFYFLLYKFVFRQHATDQVKTWFFIYSGACIFSVIFMFLTNVAVYIPIWYISAILFDSGVSQLVKSLTFVINIVSFGIVYALISVTIKGSK